MNRVRMRAARLAIFLECAGVVPIVDGTPYRECCRFLEEQYCGLDIELRRRSRIEARRRIRENGAETAAFRLIPVLPPLPIPRSLSWKQLRQTECSV